MRSTLCISVTAGDVCHSWQTQLVPIALPGSTTLGQAAITAGPRSVAFHPGLVPPLQSCLEAVLLWINSVFHCWFSVCSGKIQRISISKPISMARSINNKSRKHHIFNNYFGVPKWKGLMFLNADFSIINNPQCWDNTVLGSYTFTAYSVKAVKIYTAITCFSSLNHSRDRLSVNRRPWGSRKCK